MGIESGNVLVGIDGGGTGCRVAITYVDASPLGQATGGPANFTSDPDGTQRNILAALDAACASANLRPDDLINSVAHVGLAGVLTAQDSSTIAAALPFRAVTVTDDRPTSVTGALGGRDGVLAAIGTGTIVAAHSMGVTRYFGGWGPHLSDQASGGWLARKALRRTILAHDGLIAPSELTRQMLDHFDGALNNIIYFARDAQGGDYAALAPLVIAHAATGDVNATLIMRQGAEYLTSCMTTANLGEDAILCLSGGVGPHYEAFLPPELRRLIRPAAGSALDGALALAKQKHHDMGRAT